MAKSKRMPIQARLERVVYQTPVDPKYPIAPPEILAIAAELLEKLIRGEITAQAAARAFNSAIRKGKYDL